MGGLRIGIAGLGVVGAEVAKLLLNRADSLAAQAGTEMQLTAVSARSRTKNRGFSMDGIAFVVAVYPTVCPICRSNMASKYQIEPKMSQRLASGLNGNFSLLSVFP